MRKGIFLILTLAFLLYPWEMRGGQADQSSSSSVSELPTAFGLLFNRVSVYQKQGGAIFGLLVGVDSDSLIVRLGKNDEKVHYRNLAKVTIETEKKRGRNVLYSMLIGTYLENLIFLRAKNQPAAYMKKFEGGPFLLDVIIAAASGGLGWLISSSFEKGERVFDFTGSEEKQQAEWEKLQRFVIGAAPLRKMHLSIQAGHVFTQVSARYLNLLKSNGYDVSGYGYYIYNEYLEPASNFNLLRKLQLTYSFKPHIEFGAALLWLGEPSIMGSRWQYGPSVEVTQETDTKGYYAIGIRRLFRKKLGKRINWNIGLGMGAAKVYFRLKAVTWDSSVWPYIQITTEHKISKNLFSGMAFTELNFYLQDTLSFGLIADYAFLPSQHVPGIPDADIPAQNLRFSTGSIGFTLGLHF